MFKAKHPWIETCRNFERGCSPDPPSEDMDMGMDLMKEVMKRVAEAFDEFEKDIILKEMNKE